MIDEFSERMNAQRAILKAVNEVDWPAEDLLSLSSTSIARWIYVNRIGENDELVMAVKKAAESLLFLANVSQQQILPEYLAHSVKIREVYLEIKSAAVLRTAKLKTMI